MTREEYLNLKSELKLRAANIKSSKKQLREDIKLKNQGLPYGDPISIQQMRLHNSGQDYRYRHIFMSLLRGKTREQIEHNFLLQEPKNGLYCWREQKIKSICEKYGLECDVDENYKVISIKRDWIVTKVA